MTEKDTVAGIVGKWVEWKTGKGYFLNIDGHEMDYYGFGKCKAALGDKITIEVSPGTGTFGDKMKVEKFVDVGAGPSPPPVSPQTTDKTPKPEFVPASELPMDTNTSIVKQVCLKCASRVVSELHGRKDKIDWTEIATIVTDMADDFYNHHIGLDRPEKNPEEE